MRLLALLLLAAAAGFVVGRLTVPEERGRGGERRATTPPPDAREQAIDGNVRTEPTPPAPEVEVAATSAEVVQPSEPSEEEEERGTLVVDMAGVSGDRQIWVGCLDMFGGFELDHGGAWSEGDLDAHVTEPGTYDVWWLDAQGRRLGTRVRLEAGKVTRVRAAEHRTEAPTPKGLGALSIFVQAAGGGGQRAAVVIHDQRRDFPVWTNALGYASEVIRPGRYRVTVGGDRPWATTTPREVVVEEGRTTSFRIAHEREGDLVFVAERPLDISVYPVGGGHSSAIFIHDNNLDWIPDASSAGVTLSLPYLPEGEYETHIPFSLGVPIARFNVRAGQLTRIRCEMPKGGVRVQLTVPEGCPPYVEVELRRAEPISGHPATSMNASAGSPLEIVLTPGRYRVTARYADAEEDDAKGSGEASTEVHVEDRMIDVALELPRPR